MSNYSITVDTGARSSGSRWYSDESLAMFYRNVGVMQSALENMKGAVRGLRSGIQRANRCFAQMGFAVRSVLSGLMNTRNMVDGLQAGMKNLYRYSRVWWRSFAGTLQSLAGNAVYLRNSLAAMAAPMLKALAPAIEFVTDKFVGLFNLINQFFARLTGASTYVAARRVAGSIDGVGSSASHASDDVKELKRQLMGFDELNVLSALDEASGGGGGGSGGSGGGVEFEERQIDSALAGFVDALKGAFNAGDWQELGTLIGTKINEMVEGVDWAAAGSKVGYYVNGLFSTAYWTLETVNFTNIGESVAEFLNNALAEIDFTTVGATVALLFTSLAETVAGFVDEFDWIQFAEKLADGLNGFVSKLGEKLDAIDWGALALKLTEGLNAFIARTDWANAGKVLAGRVNDLLEILGTASANFDWSGAGEALATAVNSLFESVDWEGLGTWLNDTLLGVLDFGIAFLQGFDAQGFADDVGKALAKVDWDAVSEKLWTLFKAALDKLGEFFGTLLFGGSADMKLNLALLRDGWETVAKWLGIDKPLSALIGLVKNNWQTIARWLGIDNPVSALVGLVKNNWQTISKWLGIDNPVSALVNLIKGEPKTVDGVYTADEKKVEGETSLKKGENGKQNVGSVYTADEKKVEGKTSLEKGVKGNQTVSGVYTADEKKVEGKTSLEKGVKGKQTVSGVYTADDKKVEGKTSLEKGEKGKQTVSSVYSSDDKKVKGTTSLKKGSKGKQTAESVYSSNDKKITVEGYLSSTIHGLSSWIESIRSALKTALENLWKKITGQGAARGGVIANGRFKPFASGGIIRGGMAQYLASIPHYAGGTTRAHGTLFVAGEAGPEIMGHINGRTEILNKSQLAQTMYSAVLSAMSRAVSALGTFLSGQLANCTNAIVKTVGGLSAVANISYHEPVMASGTVLPYDVAAQIARAGMDIQNTLDANNEDLIQTIISVAGQIVAAVQSQGNREQGTGNMNGQGLTAQQVIDSINRRAQMFGSSPVLN